MMILYKYMLIKQKKSSFSMLGPIEIAEVFDK
jgi:hypothetical protein